LPELEIPEAFWEVLSSANPVDLCAQSDPIGAPEPMKIEPVLGAQIGGYAHQQPR
jgi:hypothetical protein